MRGEIARLSRSGALSDRDISRGAANGGHCDWLLQASCRLKTPPPVVARSAPTARHGSCSNDRSDMAGLTIVLHCTELPANYSQIVSLRALVHGIQKSY
jgi:hypothetical protein